MLLLKVRSSLCGSPRDCDGACGNVHAYAPTSPVKNNPHLTVHTYVCVLLLENVHGTYVPKCFDI